MNNSSCEAINILDDNGSDSDLFGEKDDAFEVHQDIINATTIKNNELNSINLDRSSNEKKYQDKNCLVSSEEINDIGLQKPDNYFGFNNSDRLFLTLKLPKRLKVISCPNASPENNPSDDMNIRGYKDQEGNIRTNSKLVSWSDGTYSLYINDQLSYDCIFGTDKASLYDDNLDSKYKIGLGHINQKLTIRPRSIEKNKVIRDSKHRTMIPTTLQEVNRSEIELRKREDEFNTIASIKLQQRQAFITSGTKKRQMTSSFLEESSEEELI